MPGGRAAPGREARGLGLEWAGWPATGARRGPGQGRPWACKARGAGAGAGAGVGGGRGWAGAGSAAHAADSARAASVSRRDAGHATRRPCARTPVPPQPPWLGPTRTHIAQPAAGRRAALQGSWGHAPLRFGVGGVWVGAGPGGLQGVGCGGQGCRKPACRLAHPGSDRQGSDGVGPRVLMPFPVGRSSARAPEPIEIRRRLIGASVNQCAIRCRGWGGGGDPAGLGDPAQGQLGWGGRVAQAGSGRARGAGRGPRQRTNEQPIGYRLN